MNTKQRKNLNIIFIVTLTFLLILISPIWRVQIINVMGNMYYSQSDIEVALNLQDNPHIFSISNDSLKDISQKLPFIETISMTKILPETLTIEVTERVPQMYLPFGGGYLLIDENYVPLAKQQQKTYDLPVIEGIRVEQFTLGEPLTFIQDEHILSVQRMVKIIEKYNLENKVQTINITNIDQIHLYIDRLNVIIGDIENFEQKIMWFSEIYKEYSVGVLDLSTITDGSVVLTPLK